MQAMVLKKLKTALEWTALPDREPGPGEIRAKVLACGVCRTDLHVVDGELPHPLLPIIPGHEIVARIEAMGKQVDGLQIGERVGIRKSESPLRRRAIRSNRRTGRWMTCGRADSKARPSSRRSGPAPAPA